LNNQTDKKQDQLRVRWRDPDTGELIQPVSTQDYHNQRRGYLDEYVLNNDPTNQYEQALREKLIEVKAAVIEKQIKELRQLTKTATPALDTNVGSPQDNNTGDSLWS
jgi:hypothetical protein